MRRVTDSHGFTIVETLIFLTVSGLLFASAMLIVSGQQAKTEFRQAVGETRSRIDDVANDVATGYYTTSGSLKCDNFFGPSVSTGTTEEQGKNLYCIVLGRAVQFKTDSNKLFVYTVVGRRIGANNSSPQTLADALPNLALAPGSYTDDALPFGLQPYSAYYADDSGAKHSVQGFAIVSKLASYSSAGSLVSGARSYDIVPIPGGSANNLTLAYTGFRDLLRDTMRAPSVYVNPPGGVTACMDGGTGQHVLLRIGASGSLATSVEYRDGKSVNDAECQV